MSSIDASEWIIINFARTVANGFRLEIGIPAKEDGLYRYTRTFEWEIPQYGPVFDEAEIDWRPSEEGEEVPNEVKIALAKDAFAQMEREANPPAPLVPEGTSLADLLS